MHVFGRKCFPNPNGPLLEERYTVSDVFSLMRSPDSRDERGLIFSFPKGIWNDPAFPRMFHPVMLISSSCLRLVLRVIREGVAVCIEEIVTFLK